MMNERGKEENKRRGHFLLIKVGNNTVIYNRHAEGELVKLFFLYVLICLLTKKKKKEDRGKRKRDEHRTA